MKYKYFFLGVGIILIIIGVVVGQTKYCQNRFSNLVNKELKNYKSCQLSTDCEIIGCGTCVNSQGAFKYNNLKKYCFVEPLWKCVIPKNCSCVDEVCTELHRS